MCLVLVMLLRVFIASLWSPEGKGLTSWLLFVMYCDFVTFTFGILGQVRYLIVSIRDPCCLSYFLFWILKQPTPQHTIERFWLTNMLYQ